MWKAIVSSSLLLSCCGLAVLAGVIHDYGHHQFDDHPQHSQHVAEPPTAHLQPHQYHHYDAVAPASLHQPPTHQQSHQPIVQQQHQHQPHEAESSKTNHDHKVEHKHAISHQSFKIHHFHPVPVYVKKDKHPIEIGGVKHKLKQVHPKHEKQHGYGLVLENHTEQKHHEVLGEEHHHPHEYHHQHTAEPHVPHVPQYHQPIAEAAPEAHGIGVHHHQPPQQQHQPLHQQPLHQQPQHQHFISQHEHSAAPAPAPNAEPHSDDGYGDYAGIAAADDESTSHYQFHDINTQHGHYESH